jgi:hypothetical protein
MYQPTPLEKKECARLLAALRLPAAVARRYRREVDEFLGILAQAGKPGRAGRGVSKFTTRRSALFRREYLVAFAEPAWMQEAAPGDIAFATPLLMLGPVDSPPIVLMPEAEEACWDEAFLSIFEHEIVHVHQFLMAQGGEPGEPTAAWWLKDILKVTRAEYEANMIQLVHWPALYEPIRAAGGLPLGAYCALRGYTLGLEKVIQAMAAGSLPEAELVEFLERLPAALPCGFRGIGLDERLGMQFARALPGHVSAALQILDRFAPGLRHSLRPPALMSWLSYNQ